MAKEMSPKTIKGLVFSLIILILVALIVIVGIVYYFVSENINRPKTDITMNEISDNTTVNLEPYEYPEINKEDIVLNAGENNDNTEYIIKTYDALGVFSAIMKDKKVYIIKENFTGIFERLYQNSTMEQNREYEVQNIENRVIDIKIGYLKNDYMSPILVILQSNGNVSYVELSKGLIEGNFVAETTTAKRVIRIENIEIRNGQEKNIGIILVQDDGTIYNIKDLIS